MPGSVEELVTVPENSRLVAKLQRRHFYYAGEQWNLHFDDKGGKSREIPVRHDLERYLWEYLDEAGLRDAPQKSPLFRTVVRREKRLTENPLRAHDLCRMVKRRLKDARLPSRLSPHSFRVATITDLLEQGVPLEDVQQPGGPCGSPHHAALRPSPAANHSQHRGADFDLTPRDIRKRHRSRRDTSMKDLDARLATQTKELNS